MKLIQAVDLFCGAGGTSTGFLKAAAARGLRTNLVAVNHWQTAINSHSLNHPGVRHICEPVENVHPREVVPSGRLHNLLASCECIFHSNARGGGPCNEQSRSQPWQLIRWATDLDVDSILMENVREFINWCPLLTRSIIYKGKTYKKHRPDPRKKGQSFRAFLQALSNIDYTVEYRIQCAADFGDATSRQRLMLMAVKRGPLVWPEPSHGPGRASPHKAARGIIDFSIKGKDVFKADGTPRHCPNTMERIKAGFRKFGGANVEAFLAILNGTSKGHLASCIRSIDEPLPTVTGSNRVMLVEPFAIHLTHHGKHESRCHSLDDPLPTITGAHRGEMALVEPFMVQTDHQSNAANSSVRSLDQPIPTVVSKQSLMLVEPFYIKYYGTGGCNSVDKPLDTVTTKARFMLVETEHGPVGYGIRTRMFQPHELSLAHSFPASYQFTGNKEDQTTQIGNSVPVELACAHAKVLL